MSRENVQVVREGYEAFAEGDLDRLFPVFDPEIALDLSRRLLEPVIYRGHEGLREFLRHQGEVWSDRRVEPEEYIAVGVNVVVPMRFVSTGRMSEIDIVARAAWVWEFRNGLAVRVTMYQSKAEALEAVGLRE